MKKVFSLLLTVLLVLFLIFSPVVLMSGADRNVFSIQKKKAEGDYRGTLKVWHVVSFRTAENSGYQYLRERSNIFEKNTPYVFVDVRGMTAEAAKELLAEGERPDIISYPLGFIEDDDLLKLNEPEDMNERLGVITGNSLPYKADHYVMVTNNDLLREYGVERTYDGEITETVVSDIFEKVRDEEKGIIPLSMTDTYGTEPQKTFEYGNFAKDEFDTAEQPREFRADGAGERSVFYEGKAGMYLCPYSEYCTQVKNQVNFSASAHDYTLFTDLVQMMGAYKSDDEEKNEMMERYISCYFTDSAQKKICGLGMLPCKVMENIYENDGELQDMYQWFLEKAVIPDK